MALGFLLLSLVTAHVALPGVLDDAALFGVLHAGMILHAGLTIYDGHFGTGRRVTWVLLIVAWTGAAMAAIAPGLVPGPWAAILAGALGVDAGTMLYDRRPAARFVLAVLSGAVVLAAVALFSDGAGPQAPPEEEAFGWLTPASIMPPMSVWPMYALLRCVPDKLGGVALMLAALMVPACWPWAGAARFRTGRSTRWVWPILCAGLAATWVWLGLLGSQLPDGGVIGMTWIAAAAYFAFFIVVPRMLPALDRPIAP